MLLHDLMRKSLLVLLLLAPFSFSLFGQQPDQTVLDKTYIYIWDIENSDWVRNQRINYTYDENLNQTEGTYYYQSESETLGWVGNWRFVYSYDGDGNRT